MPAKILLLFILFSPTVTFSQTLTKADSANNFIQNGGECSDRTFTRIEKLPSLKIPIEAYADTIVAYLKSNHTTYRNESIMLQFIVNCHGAIRDIQRITGTIPVDQVLKDAILKYTGLWLPGRQNNYIDNAYVKLDMNFSKGKLTLAIRQ